MLLAESRCSGGQQHHSNMTGVSSSVGADSMDDRGFLETIASFFGREPFSGTLTMRTVLVKPEP